MVAKKSKTNITIAPVDAVLDFENENESYQMQKVINELKTKEQQPEPLTDQIMQAVKEEEAKPNSKAKPKPNQSQGSIDQPMDKVITVEQSIEEVKPKSRAKKPKTNNTISDPVEQPIEQPIEAKPIKKKIR